MQYWQRKLQRSVTETRRSPISAAVSVPRGARAPSPQATLRDAWPHRASCTCPSCRRSPARACVTWSPVRLTLGIRAFGTNACTARRPARTWSNPTPRRPTIPPAATRCCTTSPLAGLGSRSTARSTTRRRDVRVPARSSLAPPRRGRGSAHTVLSFGGPPTFEPSAWEWAFQASPLVRARSRTGTQHRAITCCAPPRSGALHYDWPVWRRLRSPRRGTGGTWAGVECARSAESASDEPTATLREDPEFRRLTGR